MDLADLLRDPTVKDIREATVRANARYDIEGSFYELCFRVNFLPKMNLASSSRHWSYYRSIAQRWRALLTDALAQYRPLGGPLKEARIHLIRQSCVTPDYDNVSYSFKPVVDALGMSEHVEYKGKKSWVERCDIIENDDIVHLHRSYAWAKAYTRDTQGISCRLTSLPAPPSDDPQGWQTLAHRRPL